MHSYDKDLSMKLKNLFENEVLQEAKEKNLIGQTVNGKVIDENTPKEAWNGDFSYADKRLTSLKGSPEKVTGYFYCYYNRLTSLEGGPQEVGGSFYCPHNRLTSLTGAPTTVGGDFNCTYNMLISLEGAPPKIGGNFSCSTNRLTSLHNVHKIIKNINGVFYATSNPIESHVLGLMLIDGLTSTRLDNNEVQNILNNGIKNKKHWTEVQAELEEAGFEEYAQL